jgi:ABC-2 type transport system permease protein
VLLTLLRLRWRLFVNRLLRSEGPLPAPVRVTLGAAALAAFLGVVGVNVGTLGATLANIDPSVQPALVPGLLVAVIVLTVTTALSAPLHHLFLAPDLDLLLVAPITRRDLFGLKLLETWRDSGHVFLFGVVALGAYGQHQGRGPAYFLLAAVVTGALTLATSAVGLLLTTLMGRLSLSRALMSLMRLLSVLLFLPLALFAAPLFGTGRAAGVFGLGSQGTQALTEALRDMGEPPWWSPTTWAAWALDGQLMALFPLVLLCAAVLGAAYLTYASAFAAAWEYLRSAPPPAARDHGRRLVGAYRLLQPFPAPLRAMVLKDVRTLVRDPRWLTTAVIGTLMLGAPAVLLSARSRPLGPFSRADAFFLSLFAAPYLAYLVGSQVGSSSLAHEGRNIALLRCAPVGLGRLLAAKLCVALVPVLCVTWAVTIGLGIWRGGQPAQVGLALLAVGWLSAGSTGAGLAGAALTVDLSDDGLSPQRRVGCLGSAAASLLSGFFFVSNGALLAWLLLQSVSRLPRGMSTLVGIIDAGLVVLAATSAAAIAGGLVLGARRLGRLET